MKDAYDESREAFAKYAAMDAPGVPEDPLSALQVRLARWQTTNIGLTMSDRDAMGVSEEVGELATAVLALAATSGRISHLILKSNEKIRQLGDETTARKAVADAIADQLIFLTQLATTLRLDLGTLYEKTAEQVMLRDFKRFPKNGLKE